jgi:hypothetical protein
MDGHTDGWISRQLDGGADIWMDGKRDGWMNIQMVWMDRRKDGMTDSWIE